MKKLLLALLFCLTFSGCSKEDEVVFVAPKVEPHLTIKIIGSGKFGIGFYDDDYGKCYFESTACQFDKKMRNGNFWVVSAYSKDKKGIRVEVYKDGKLIESQKETFENLVSINGVY